MNAALLSPFTKRRVALLVGLLGLGVFLAFLYLAFAGSGLITFGGRKVDVVFADGLNLVPRSSEVRLHGLQVGTVQSIELRDDDVVATITLDSSVDLREDVSATLLLKSLLGEKYIDLDPGTADAEFSDRAITNTAVGVDATTLSAGGPGSAKLYKDLAGGQVMRGLDTAANQAPTLASRIQLQIDQLRAATDQLVAGQANMLATIDNLASLTSSLVASSDSFGSLLASGEGIQNRVEYLQDIAVVQFARADTAVKIVLDLVDERMPDLEALNARLRIVIRDGMDAFDLLQQGASVPSYLWGFGPLGFADHRQPGPNPSPPYPLYPVPSEEEIEAGQ